jgi:hypothetical protein
LASSRDFNKLVIKAKMHAKTPFFFLRYNMIFYFFLFLKRLGRMHENKKKHLFLFFYYYYLRKTRYLISNLYLYSIKIQTDIDQNAVKYLRKIKDF